MRISPRKIYWLASLVLRMPWLKTNLTNWQDFLLDCFGWKPAALSVYSSFNGQRYLIRSKTIDLGILDEVVLEKIYQPPGLNLSEIKTVVDVGAQIGIFSLWISGLMKKNSGIVLALEPEKENFELLKKNLDLNRSANIRPFNLALSGRRGTAALHTSSLNRASHSFYFRGLADGQQIVETTTLDSFLEEEGVDQIDLLKIDSEGSEYDILFGASLKTFGKIKNMAIEYHNLSNQRCRKTLEGFLKSRGFNLSRAPFPSNVIYARS